MTLYCNNPFGQSYGIGIYISLVKIIDAVNISGADIFSTGNPYDLAIRLYLDIKKGFYPEYIIAGNFKREPSSGEVIGWGSAFVIHEFLHNMGYNGKLNPDNSIPRTTLESLIGRSFYRLSYISGTRDDGKFKYTDWNIISTEEEGAESLLKRFQKSLQIKENKILFIDAADQIRVGRAQNFLDL